MLNLFRTIAYRFSPILLATVLFSTANAQRVVDKTVATVSDGVRTELITYSDLLWQLALIPGIEIAPPASEDLNRALQLIIRQRLIALEAERLPRETEITDEEVEEEIQLTVRAFPTASDFQLRLSAVGFRSVDDKNFKDLIRQRISIQKYIDFRFRSFVVITPEQELRYYRDVYTPEFRELNPGRILPKLEDVRKQINVDLTNEQVAADIERFIDAAESRAEIVILSEV